MYDFQLKDDDKMFCLCGNASFALDSDGETVMCIKCKKMFKLGQHLYSGCAEVCGMLYPYNWSEKENDFLWEESMGSQDWRDGKSTTNKFGSNWR